MTSPRDCEFTEQRLIEEISALEELLAENSPPEDHDGDWSLHLVRVMLRLRREQLRELGQGELLRAS